MKNKFDTIYSENEFIEVYQDQLLLEHAKYCPEAISDYLVDYGCVGKWSKILPIIYEDFVDIYLDEDGNKLYDIEKLETLLGEDDYYLYVYPFKIFVRHGYEYYTEDELYDILDHISEFKYHEEFKFSKPTLKALSLSLGISLKELLYRLIVNDKDLIDYKRLNYEKDFIAKAGVAKSVRDVTGKSIHKPIFDISNVDKIRLVVDEYNELDRLGIIYERNKYERYENISDLIIDEGFDFIDFRIGRHKMRLTCSGGKYSKTYTLNIKYYELGPEYLHQKSNDLIKILDRSHEVNLEK